MTDPHPSPRGPDVAVPPPFLFVGGFLAGWLMERYVVRVPLVRAPDTMPVGPTLAWLAVLAGLGLLAWAFAAFWRARTPILPTRPASRLVAEGPYAFTRNPMYVGLSFLYAGFAILFNYTWPLVTLPLVWVALYHFVVKREERYLDRAFGEVYAEYRGKVRRWL